MRHSRGIWHTKPHFRWRKSKPLLPFSQRSFFFFSLCSICERPPADSCSLSRCFSSFYTINKTSWFKLWHITGSENHMEIHANSTSCAPAGLGSVIHILDVIYYRLNVTRQLDKRTHVVLFFFKGSRHKDWGGTVPCSRSCLSYHGSSSLISNSSSTILSVSIFAVQDQVTHSEDRSGF